MLELAKVRDNRHVDDDIPVMEAMARSGEDMEVHPSMWRNLYYLAGQQIPVAEREVMQRTAGVVMYVSTLNVERWTAATALQIINNLEWIIPNREYAFQLHPLQQIPEEVDQSAAPFTSIVVVGMEDMGRTMHKLSEVAYSVEKRQPTEFQDTFLQLQGQAIAEGKDAEWLIVQLYEAIPALSA